MTESFVPPNFCSYCKAPVVKLRESVRCYDRNTGDSILEIAYGCSRYRRWFHLMHDKYHYTSDDGGKTLQADPSC